MPMPHSSSSIYNVWPICGCLDSDLYVHLQQLMRNEGQIATYENTKQRIRVTSKLQI